MYITEVITENKSYPQLGQEGKTSCNIAHTYWEIPAAEYLVKKSAAGSTDEETSYSLKIGQQVCRKIKKRRWVCMCDRQLIAC